MLCAKIPRVFADGKDIHSEVRHKLIPLKSLRDGKALIYLSRVLR